jgi:hypothetical protein
MKPRAVSVGLVLDDAIFKSSLGASHEEFNARAIEAKAVFAELIEAASSAAGALHRAARKGIAPSRDAVKLAERLQKAIAAAGGGAR